MSDQPISDEVDERFQILESKILHQEQTIEELNSVVIRQQNQVDELQAEVKRLAEGFDTPSPTTADPDEEPPPPHY
ncbi:MAG: SlyX family protein [Candidatus Binatia bacterium]|nr:SlyX family protein [Candidatus Binatia bacterium]